MIQKEIIEGNKLIAEFMGAIITQCYSYIEDIQDGLEYYFSKENAPEDRLRYSSSGIKYHSSWDWLMSVVEKIESLGYSSEIYCIGGFENRLQFFSGGVSPVKSRCFKLKIEAVYYTVVEFIKWYNAKSE